MQLIPTCRYVVLFGVGYLVEVLSIYRSVQVFVEVLSIYRSVKVFVEVLSIYRSVQVLEPWSSFKAIVLMILYSYAIRHTVSLPRRQSPSTRL
jgi:hypothetical protein